MTLPTDTKRELLQRARQTFATYLCLKAELRSYGVSEALIATLEAGEHAAWDLQHVWTAPSASTVSRVGGIDVSGNLITGP